jgi:hypothetical protein
MLRNNFAGAVIHGRHASQIQVGQLVVRSDEIVKGGPLEIPTSLQRNIDYVLAGFHQDLGASKMLNLKAATEVQILDERSRSGNDIGQRLCGYFGIELGSIETSPKLAIEA